MISLFRRLFQKTSLGQKKSPTSPLKKVDILEQQISLKKHEADELAIQFKKCYEEAKNRNDELDSLTAQADHEANEMRSCFQLASSAYEEKDGASAKAWSLKGHAHKDAAGALNAKAQAIRDISNRGKDFEAKCKLLNSEVRNLLIEKKNVDEIKNLYECISTSNRAILDKRLSYASQKSLKLLSSLLVESPEDARLLIQGLGNSNLNDEMAATLPDAIANLFHIYNRVPGLTQPLRNRGPGVRACISNLSNSNSSSASGTAYEILAASQLTKTPAGHLKLSHGDKPAFGPKLQAKYEGSPLKTKELLSSLIQISTDRWGKLQRNSKALARKTVESDLHILKDSKEIMVDFKYSNNSKRGLDPSQLLGVAVALSTNEIDEAYFISNASFDRVTKKRVNDINIILKRWSAGVIYLQGNYGWK